MAGEQASSSSKNQCPDQSDELWYEQLDPLGMEFDLPDLSDLVSCDGNDGFVASSFGPFDVPFGIDEASLQVITDPLQGGNMMDSFIAPSVGNTLFMDDRQKDISPTNVHIPADGSLFGCGILQPAQNQSNDILVAPNMCLSGSNDFAISNNHAYSSSSRNEGAPFPAIDVTGLSIPVQTPNYVSLGPLGLKPSALAMDIPVFVPTPSLTQIKPTMVNLHGPKLYAQAFSDCPFQGANSSFCNVPGCCGIVQCADNIGAEREFTVSDAFGGNVGFFENPIPMYLNSSTITVNVFPLERTAEGNNDSIKGKRKLSIPSANEAVAGVRLPHGDYMEGKDGGQYCKRFKFGTSEPGGSALWSEYSSTGPMGETYAPGFGRDMIFDTFGTNDVAHVQQLVFKGPLNSKNSRN